MPDLAIVEALTESRAFVQLERHVWIDSFKNLGGPDIGKVTDTYGLEEIAKCDALIAKIDAALTRAKGTSNG